MEVHGELASSGSDVNSTFAAPPPTKVLTNSIGMKFVSIPTGEFLMGTAPDEIKVRRDQLVKRSDDLSQEDG